MTDYIKEAHTTIFIGQTSYGKTDLVLDLIEKEYNKPLTTISSSAQHFDGMKHIIPRTGSKMMIRLGL